jgi:hypothetical protein
MSFSIPDNGGYTVQPVPAPTSINAEINNNKNEGGNNQKLKLFNLEMPYQVHLSLKELINYQTTNHSWHNHKKNHNKCMRCYNNIIKLIIT